MAQSKSSRKWLARQQRCPYVKEAKAKGYRSRASFKLKEIDERDALLRPGMRVVDLGAAPGGWSQYARERIGDNGWLCALDLLAMEPIYGVDIVEGDFTDDAVWQQLEGQIGGKQQLDVVLSDMAPNMSGQKSVDIPKAIGLCEEVVYFSRHFLKPGGCLLMKVFQGEGYKALMDDLKASFKSVVSRKPKASRDASREMYLLAKCYKL